MTTKISKLFILILLCSVPAGLFSQKIIKQKAPKREAGQKDVLELRCDPIQGKVRIAVIGLGMRGSDAVYRLSQIEDAEVTVICDVQPDKVKESQEILKKLGRKPAVEYTGTDDWKKICERNDLDLIYVCTHWDLHAPIGVYAMQKGKHVALEVPAALTIKECWDLVNTAEKTQRHCMMLENCNYDFFELTTLNMAQKGLFGEIVHVEGAYIHDLRFLFFDEKTGYWDMWRIKHNQKSNGNLYPTHGLGPVCHVLNIHRGDRMEHLVSISSNQFGLSEYAKEKFGENSAYGKADYKRGDMNTTIIRTAKGKTMMIQHNTTNPRPYSRIHMISGTKGFAQKYPLLGISFEPDGHRYLNKEKLDSVLKVYEHPFIAEIGEKAKKVGGHGGMDFIMDYRLIYCLKNGLPLDQDVYDAAEWSAIVELSRISNENKGAPVEIPDFTRGAWNKVKSLKYYTK